MTAVIGGSTKFGAGVVHPAEVGTMIPIVTEAMWKQARAGADPELARYVRWEYGASDPDFLLAETTSVPVERRAPSLRTRLRYWLNSFRGYAAFDLRETADRTHR